jgi:hypothetical protein
MKKQVKAAKPKVAKKAASVKAAKGGRSPSGATSTKKGASVKAAPAEPKKALAAKKGSKTVASGSSKKAVASKKPAAAKARDKGEAVETSAKDDGAQRKLGLRGAAPWAARHAAKHAAEAKARAAQPAPPGSARATIRVPTGADAIKAKVAELHTQVQRIKTLRKRFDRDFFEIGEILASIHQQELYVAKGFSSFEAFVEREVEISKQICVRLVKISQIFQKESAIDYGVDRVMAALSALEGELLSKPVPSSAISRPSLPLKPPSSMRVVG